MLQTKSNHSLNYKVRLYREVNDNLRYYTLNILPTLFGEYLLIREFGGVKNKKPTRVIKKYFSHIEECQKVLDSLVCEKIKKGYFV